MRGTRTPSFGLQDRCASIITTSPWWRGWESNPARSAYEAVPDTSLPAGWVTGFEPASAHGHSVAPRHLGSPTEPDPGTDPGASSLPRKRSANELDGHDLETCLHTRSRTLRPAFGGPAAFHRCGGWYPIGELNTVIVIRSHEPRSAVWGMARYTGLEPVVSSVTGTRGLRLLQYRMVGLPGNDPGRTD